MRTRNINYSYTVDMEVEQEWSIGELQDVSCVFRVTHGIENDTASNLKVTLIGVDCPLDRKTLVNGVGAYAVALAECDFAEHYLENFDIEDIL